MGRRYLTAVRRGVRIIAPPSLPADTRVFRGQTVPQEPLVLLVEDDPLAREGYAEFLEGGGFRVAQCETAEDAYSRSLELVPDVVVTDIALPGRDGFSLAADLRVQTRTRSIPVVAMTAYWAADVHERADRAGMTSILMKPCQPDHLIAELHRVLRSDPTALRATQSAAATASRGEEARRQASFLIKVSNHV